MTDFVRRILRPPQPDWIIRSLLDGIDFYKFTMGLFIYRFYRGVQVTFGFINRHLHIPVADLIDEGELRAQLDHVRTLRFLQTEIYYLRGMDVYGEAMFPKDYLEFLSQLQMTPYELTRVGNQYKLTFSGPWEVVTFWETIALPIIMELLNRKLLRSIAENSSAGETELRVLYARATDKLYRKLQRLKRRETIRFADFGLRRRHSYLWQRFAIQMAGEVMGPNFIGTSNTGLAKLLNLVPIGTYAHELPMVLTALAESDEEKRDAQYEVLRKWQQLFPKALRILLPDTYGSQQFYNNMPKDLAQEVAHDGRGARGDSGNLVEEGNRYVAWLRANGANPREKLYVPSDGLDVELMLNLDTTFNGWIQMSDGWGTKLTGDFDGCHPRGEEIAVIDGMQFGLTWDQLLCGHSIVCKVVSANGKRAVKLSNNIKKATGPKDEVKRYERVFGNEGRIEQEVVV
ncbi:MAG: nicotinate phosphoribosyltransferase [bacterium]|nr:nicotinate phosphoribosyltransferase [bacterium]